VHFERGRDYPRAARYRQHAADTALGRYAYHEALAHLTGAIELLHKLPEAPERTRQELTVQIMLGSVVSALKGYAAPEAE
jgi:predicted ATPase